MLQVAFDNKVGATDDQEKLSLTKFVDYTDVFAVHVVATKGSRVISNLNYGFKKAEIPIDLTAFKGKDLLDSRSQPYRSDPLLAYDKNNTVNPVYMALNIPVQDTGGKLRHYLDFTSVNNPDYSSGASGSFSIFGGLALSRLRLEL